jgi:predicted transcriptional regulator
MPDATCRHKDGVDFNKLELLRKRMLLSVTDLASILGTSRMSYYTWLEGGEIRKSNIKKINLKIDKLKNIISKYNWPNNVLELEQKDRKAKLIKLLEQC